MCIHLVLKLIEVKGSTTIMLAIRLPAPTSVESIVDSNLKQESLHNNNNDLISEL
jgi:hypothetical protein